MKIISNRQRITITDYSFDFEWVGCPGAGFSFECDKDGNIYFDNLPKIALLNLNSCLCGEYAVDFVGVRKSVRTYTESAVGRCDCGEKVYLEGFTNTCYKCKADYNQSGQRLAPRSHWGEETGERWFDIN